MNRIFLTRFALTSAAALGLLIGCGTVADLAGYDSRSMNESAAKSYTQVVSEAKSQGAVDTTSAIAKRVQTIFKRMKPFAEAANQTGVPFDWQMTVIRSNELNAWAMPGGKMVVYTGLVSKLKLTDDETAAVVGHEMTHALHEHSKKAAGQQLITNTAMNIGGQVLAAKTGIDGTVLSTSQDLLSQYGIGLPFSRSQESDADKGGLMLMAQAGYNPQAAVTVWEKMNQLNNNNSVLSAITSTHPTNNNRIDAIRKLLPEVMPIYEKNKR
ncbi:M48 family metallopeptidase [Stenoxybacter acetivorans]|uniref:M48 family metallopeptidase n=1 Tax=Stenoxybacter acetivorans TaxID=422441 RepID=UPI000566283C|nr:M48 family metallopeptidase [Stenoxybacter acetivorans]